MSAMKQERLFERAWQAHSDQNFELASERWQTYLAQYPNDEQARANFVLSLLANEDFMEALRQARKGIRNAPNFQGAREVFLQTLEANELMDEMEQEAERQRHETPEDPLLWEAKGRCALYREDFDKAERYFKKAVRLNPQSNFAWSHIAEFCFASGRVEEAFDAFGQMAATADDSPVPSGIVKHHALLNQAMCLLYMEMPDRALILAEQAEALNIDVGYARMVQARAKFSLGHSDAASVAESAVRLGAKNGYLMMALANYYAESGNKEQSKKILDSEDPGSDGYALNIRGVALARVGRHEEAMMLLESLKDKLPEFVRLNSLAAANLIADKPKEALDNLVEALKHKEDHVIRTNTGILCLQLSDQVSATERRVRLLTAAESHLQRALQLQPDSLSATYNLGFCYLLQGKEGKARSELRKVAESTRYDSNLKAAARELLGGMDSGEAMVGWMKAEDLTIVSRTEGEEARQLLNHYRSRRFEDECRRLAAMTRGNLRWQSAESHKTLKHGGKQKEVDVYGTSTGADGEMVHLGECKMRIEGSEPVSDAEINELVSKLEFVRTFDDLGRSKVEGAFFTNTDYSPEALKLAQEYGIRVYKARLKKNWQKSPDWTVTSLKEIDTDSEMPNTRNSE